MRTIRYYGPKNQEHVPSWTAFHPEIKTFVHDIARTLNNEDDIGCVKLILEPGDATHYEAYLIYDDSGYTIVKVGELQMIMFLPGHSVEEHPQHHPMNLWTIYMWHTLIWMVDNVRKNYPHDLNEDKMPYSFKDAKCR